MAEALGVIFAALIAALVEFDAPLEHRALLSAQLEKKLPESLLFFVSVRHRMECDQ